MNKKKKTIYGLLILVVIAVGFLGASFALWTQNFVQSGENTIVSDCFQITLKEEEGITLKNIFPMYDRDGKKLTPYTFQVSNICNRKVEYQLNFETTNNTTLSDSYVKFMFQDEDPVLLSEREETSVTLTNGLNAYVLEKGYLKGEEVRDYSIRIWMDERVTEDNTDAMDKYFEGKITVYASYLPEYDEEKPIADFTYQREENKLIVDASTSFDSESEIIYYYYSTDGENWKKTKESRFIFEEDMEYGNGISALSSLYEFSIKEVYVKVEDELGNISEVVSEDIQELIYDDTVDKNLRYIGPNPNNYVLFNNELWRIVGILKVPEGKRLKLVRYESIGNYVFNANATFGNDYSKSTLMSMLNEGPYYNRTNGTCYSTYGSVSVQNPVSCDFSYIGLLTESKQMIDSITWNLGGYHSTNLLANQFYTYERGDIVYSGNNIVWKGKIGLIYPSDYLNATKGGKNITRSDCLLKEGNRWSSNVECQENDWLTSKRNFTLDSSDVYHVLFNDSFNKNNIYSVDYVGNATNSNGHINAAIAIYPSVYLKENIQIVSGDGTRSNPYQLTIS